MSKKNRNKTQAQVAETEEQLTLVETSDTPAETVAELPVVEEPQQDVEEVSTVVEEPAVNDESVVEEKPVVEEAPDINEEPKKPQTNKGILRVEKKATPVRAAVSVPKTAGVVAFDALAARYLATMKPGRIDDEARRRALITLANMCNHVCMSNDPAVFETCFRFFMENRSIMLAQSTVIAGIEKAIDKAKIAKVLQFYTVFQSLVESKLLNNKYTLNITTIRRLLGNDALANWLIAKRG